MHFFLFIAWAGIRREWDAIPAGSARRRADYLRMLFVYGVSQDECRTRLGLAKTYVCDLLDAGLYADAYALRLN